MSISKSTEIYLVSNNKDIDKLKPLERLDLSQWSLAIIAQRLLLESDSKTKPIMLAVMMCLYDLEIKTKTPTARETLVSSFTVGGVRALMENPLIEDKDKEILEISIGSWTPYREKKQSHLKIVEPEN